MARHNLALVPALKVDASTWFGPVGWARTAAAHASLSRDTAWAGSAVGNVAASRADVTAGDWVVASIEAYFGSPGIVQVNLDWYAAANVYLSTTSGPIYNQTGGTTLRMVAGVGQAPATAVRVTLTVNGIDGAMQLTALLVEKFASEAAADAVVDDHASVAYYFDGDGSGDGVTAGYSWDGANGESASTSTANTAATAAVSFGAVSISGLGTRTSTGTGSLTFGTVSIATGLIATAAYDRRRGRIRVDAIGLQPSVIRAVVSARVANTGRFVEIRGGRVNVSGNRFARKIDHYEYVAGASMEYQIVALASAENSPDVIVQTKIIVAQDTDDQVWLKFIVAPDRNRRVILHDWSPITREGRATLHQVRDRPDPIAVTDVHTSRAMTVQLITETVADRDALDVALARGAPVFFQTPTDITCPSMYAVVGGYSIDRLAKRSLRSLFTVPLTEVAAPPLSVVGVGLTWDDVISTYATWQELLTDTERTIWGDLAS